MPQQPNILVILTDQQSAGTLSCDGHPDLRTPHLDSLAALGVRFTQTYCTFPLCSAARFSLMTGRYPHELACSGNSVITNDAVTAASLGRILNDAGYDCGYAGKWHVGPATVPEGWGFECLAPFGDEGLDDACSAFIRRRHDRPFLLVASFDNPHNICEWARHQRLPWGDVPDVPTEQCPNLPANFEIAPYAPEAVARERAANHQVHPTLDKEPDWWRHYRHAYFRLIEKADAQIGRILSTLREVGLEDDTLVVFTSDHGDGHGAHRWNQKSSLQEECVRVPLILAWKGHTRPGSACDELVSNGLDLLPTLCDYTGIPQPPNSPGRSLRGLAETGQDDDWRTWLTVETHFAGLRYLGTTGRMIRTRRYKYAVYHWGRHREQLHDLIRDPGEMVNLAVEARHQGLLEEHRYLLDQWCSATADGFRR